MMRSMYAGVSGLRTHQSKMDVIGNNIANVNTIGFKKGQMTFQEVFSQTLKGGSAPQDGRGGTNPQQVGLGVGVGSISTIHTQGSMQPTDKPTDLMIDGEGFFVVSDDTNFENKYYTRAGNFSLDRDGNLVTADGYKVLGYMPDDEGNIGSNIGAIRVNKSENVGATTTKNIEHRGNLDSRLGEDDDPHISDTVIKDSLGNSYTVSFKFEKTGTNTWEASVDKIIDQATKQEIEAGVGSEVTSLTFDSNGKLIDGSEKVSTLAITKDGVNFGNGEASEIEIDFSKLTQYANDMDAKPYESGGQSSGKIEGFSIDPKGVVLGVFTNGERKALGQLQIAKFDNPMGLEKIGGNFFVDTRNSGEAQLGVGGSSGYGDIAASTLEMSNVDLSMEFTEMITTQRGFQANSRIITTSDEMLQELVNIKR